MLMGISREQLIAAIRQPTPAEATAFQALVERRAAREPLAYITGHREFWSLDFKVGPGVLVPRPETETLIERRFVPISQSRYAPLNCRSGDRFGCASACRVERVPRGPRSGF